MVWTRVLLADDYAVVRAGIYDEALQDLLSLNYQLQNDPAGGVLIQAEVPHPRATKRG